MLREQTLREIRDRAKEWINREAVPVVSGSPPSPEETIQMVDEILDFRESMSQANDDDNDCCQEKHCSCVPYLQHRVSVLEDAIRGAVDHSDLDGPDILDEAADMLEEKTITLASQLRKTAKMQRETLQEEGK